VSVLLYDEAGTPAVYRGRARAVVDRILAAAGVRLEWFDEQAARARRLSATDAVGLEQWLTSLHSIRVVRTLPSRARFARRWKQRRPADAVYRNASTALLPVYRNALAALLAQPRDRRSQVRLRRVPEFHHERVALERLLHDPALDALAAAVNEAHFAQSRLVGGVHVLFDDGRDVARGERVQVDRVLDGDPVRHGAV
jgi:hypothetical protein